MFEGEVFSDFALLWLLCHQSRVESDNPSACWLEQWAKSAQDQGVRALDTLRGSVQKSIEILGQGFLESYNPELKERLRSGALSQQDYFRQLLRLVYRLLFLFAAGSRTVAYPRNTRAGTQAFPRGIPPPVCAVWRGSFQAPGTTTCTKA